MNLEDTMEHKIRQAQENEFYIISFIKKYHLMEEGGRKMSPGVRVLKGEWNRDYVGVPLRTLNPRVQTLVLSRTALSEFFVIQSLSKDGGMIAKCFIKNSVSKTVLRKHYTFYCF